MEILKKVWLVRASKQQINWVIEQSFSSWRLYTPLDAYAIQLVTTLYYLPEIRSVHYTPNTPGAPTGNCRLPELSP